MTDIYSTELCDTLLDLENNPRFIKELEKLAAQATPSFYKYNLKGDILFANSNGGFLSYNIKECFSALINDTIAKYSEVTSPLITEHFLDYYVTEIKLGACFLDSVTVNVLNLRGVKSKKAISEDLRITIYRINKIFDHFPSESYNRFLQVQNRTPYSGVML